MFKILTPAEIFLDVNNNMIFDENQPFKISDIHFAGENNTNSDVSSVLSQLSDDENLFAKYMVNFYAQQLLHNRFVQIKDSDIFINGEKYSQLMLNTKFVFDESEKSKKEFIDNIKSINLDEYVLYNGRTKKYHNFKCKHSVNNSGFKILKIDTAKQKGEPCKLCILKNNNYPLISSVNNSNLDFEKPDDIFHSENIIIFFQDLNKIFIPSFDCVSTACRYLKKEIDNSKKSIDFAIYGINNQPVIFNSLVSAAKRGVKIRWIYDFDKNNNYYKDSDKLKKYLKNYKTDEFYEMNAQSAIMHNKFFIFDNQKVWTGSSNITSTDLTGFNANYSVLINSRNLAEKYTQEFNQMYGGSFHKSKKSFDNSFININSSTKIKPLFSPQDNIIYSEIIPVINNAKKYIYIPIFTITNKDMANALISAHNRGVDVKLIVDATNAHTKYTVHKKLREAGIKVKTENYAGKMHMKAIVVDDLITFLGSMNYTNSANNKNDENVLLIYSCDAAKFIKNTFLYLWDKIPVKYEKYDPRSESKESIGSCFDGIDNNFDGKTDSEDTGCF